MVSTFHCPGSKCWWLWSLCTRSQLHFLRMYALEGKTNLIWFFFCWSFLLCLLARTWLGIEPGALYLIGRCSTSQLCLHVSIFVHSAEGWTKTLLFYGELLYPPQKEQHQGKLVLGAPRIPRTIHYVSWWLIMIANVMGFSVTMETNLWPCVWIF